MFTILKSTLSALSFIFNFTIVLLFLFMIASRKVKRANLMFFLQAITDIIVTVPMLILALAPFLSTDSEHMELMILFFLDYSQVLAINILLLITTERFIAINYPLKHRTIVTKQKIVTVAVCLYIFSSIPALIFVFYIFPHWNSLDDKYHPSHHTMITIYLLIMGIIIIVTIIIVFFLLVLNYVEIRKSMYLRIRRYDGQLSITNQTNQRILREKKKNKRVITILVIMFGIYAVTYLPYAFFQLLHFFLKDFINRFNRFLLVHCLTLLYLSSAVLNPCITICLKEDYRNLLPVMYRRLSFFPQPSLASSLRKLSLYERTSTKDTTL